MHECRHKTRRIVRNLVCRRQNLFRKNEREFKFQTSITIKLIRGFERRRRLDATERRSRANRSCAACTNFPPKIISFPRLKSSFPDWTYGGIIPYGVYEHHGDIRNVRDRRGDPPPAPSPFFLFVSRAHSSPRRSDTHCHIFAAAVLPVYIPHRSTGRTEWGGDRTKIVVPAVRRRYAGADAVSSKRNRTHVKLLMDALRYRIGHDDA